MPLLGPNPADLPVLLLQALGAPAGITFLVALSLFIIGWVTAIIHAARTGQKIGGAATRFWLSRTTLRLRGLIVYSIIALVFTTFFVAGVRLTPRYFGQSASSGVWGDWNWITVLNGWDSDASWYLFAAAGSVFLLAIANLASFRYLTLFLAIPWTIVLTAALGIGALWGVACLGNLFMIGLAALAHNPSRDYTWATTAGFFALSITLVVPALLGPVLVGQAAKTFGSKG